MPYKIIIFGLLSFIAGFSSGVCFKKFFFNENGVSGYGKNALKEIKTKFRKSKVASVGVDLPLSDTGYYPEFFSDFSTVFKISESANTTLGKISSNVRNAIGKGFETIAFEVRDHRNRIKIIPYSVPVLVNIGEKGACRDFKKLLLPWHHPVEPSDAPATFPLCPGAQIGSMDELGCLEVEVGKSANNKPQEGGGCRGPATFIIIRLMPYEKSKLMLLFQDKPETEIVNGVNQIKTVFANRFSLGKRLSYAFLLVLDSESNLTLQNFVELLELVFFSRVPVADYLWVKGWERS